MQTIYYEWDKERIDEHGDIIDHSFADSLKDLKNHEGILVLVRDAPRSRSWAYVEDEKLPEYFLDAFGNQTAKVPQRFHRELKNNFRN